MPLGALLGLGTCDVMCDFLLGTLRTTGGFKLCHFIWGPRTGAGGDSLTTREEGEKEVSLEKSRRRVRSGSPAGLEVGPVWPPFLPPLLLSDFGSVSEMGMDLGPP